MTITTEAYLIGPAENQMPADAWCRRASLDASGAVRLALTYDWWTWPVQDRANATTTINIWPNPDVWSESARWSTWAARLAAKYPLQVPWNPDLWRTGSSPAGTNPDLGVIVNNADGSGWELLGLRKPAWWQVPAVAWQATPGLFQPTRYRAGDYIADMAHVRNATTLGHYQGRGCGDVAKITGLVRGRHLLDGLIPFAVAIAAPTQWGPGARYVPPATRVEWSDRSPYGTSLVIPPGDTPAAPPHGSRFALSITDAEIDAWLDSRSYTGALRRTARTFAVALRDFGWWIAETGTGQSQIESTGINGPDATAFYLAGITTRTTALTLLDGLITRDRTYTVHPTAAYAFAA